jgi:prepilin-type N-terminal cleavage/methylation domain-containing protein
MNKFNRDERGFNLIELMIVIAIIGLLIGISGFAWQVMVRRGNEAAALGYINKINTAQAHFASKHHGRFAATFDQLIRLNLLDKRFEGESPVLDGYVFSMKAEEKPVKFFSVNADPEVATGVTATGHTSYYLDSTLHTITFTDEARPATARDDSM